MRCWKNNINILFPDILILSSQANEGAKTDQDIMKMGENLATEVIDFVRDWTAKIPLGKLSFIGHSMGGLIIRAALPRLDCFKMQMHTILTLGSPHMGYMYNKSKLIDTGR